MLLSANAIEEFFSLLANLVGVLGFVAAFFVGKFGAWLLSLAIDFVSNKIDKKFKRSNVDLMIRSAIVLIAVVVTLIFRTPITSIVDSLLPIGDFDEITKQIADANDGLLANAVLETMFTQIAWSFAYFIPFLGVDILISFIEGLICNKDDDDAFPKSIFSYALDFLSIAAVNAIVLCFGDSFFQIIGNFIFHIDFSLEIKNIVTFLFLLLVFCVMMYYTLRDFFSTDIILAFFSVNVIAALMGIAITDSNKYFIMICAIIFGLLARIIRKLIIQDDRDDSDQHHLIFGLCSIPSICLVLWGVWTLVLKYIPNFLA